MRRLFCFKLSLIIILVLFALADFGCGENETFWTPKVGDEEEYSITLEVYRTGTDLMSVTGKNDYHDLTAAVAGRGGVLLIKTPDLDRFHTVYTGVANDLTAVFLSSEEIMIGGMGLGLSDPGIIRQRGGVLDLTWSDWSHPARGGITAMTWSSAVTSVGEIMTSDGMPAEWFLRYEDTIGPGFNGVVFDAGIVTAVGSSGRIFRNQAPHDFSVFIDETIAGGPDFSDVRYHVDSGGLGEVITAVGGREVWQRVSGSWTRVLDSAPGDLYAINQNGYDGFRTWIVGAEGTIIGNDGSGWTDNSVGADVTFRSIGPNGIVACGEDGAIYFNDPSSGWTDAGYSNISTWNDFDGLSPTEIYAANGDTLMGWDGVSWNPIATPWGGEIISLHAVSSDRIWIVTLDGYDTFVQSWNGSTFNISHQSSMDAFNSIWSDASGDAAFVAAGNGYIFFLDGFWDMVMADPSGRDFYDVDGTSATDVYAVGEQGLIMHFNGSTWTAMSTGDKNHTLRAIDGPVAVGDNGTVLRRSGSSWVEEDSGTTAHLYSVCYLSDKDIWAAGEGSQIIHYDGSKWQVYQQPLMNVDIHTVWADVSSPNDVWFGGEEGFLLKYLMP